MLNHKFYKLYQENCKEIVPYVSKEESRLIDFFLYRKKTISKVIHPSSNFRLKMFISPLNFSGFVILVRKIGYIVYTVFYLRMNHQEIPE